MTHPGLARAMKGRHQATSRFCILTCGDIGAKRHQRGARSKSTPYEAKEGRGTLAILCPTMDPLSSCLVAAAPPMLKSHQPHRRKPRDALKIYVERSIPRDRHGIN